MPIFSARVHVRLKPSVLDPQGKAVEHALKNLGFAEAKNVRLGKYFELDIEADSEKSAKDRVSEMAETLLTNSVIEDFTVSVNGARS